MLAGAIALGPTAVAQQQVASAPPEPNTGVARVGPRVGARTELFSTTIQGNALSSTNKQLADTYVRLRDARYGRLLGTQVTDQSGLFAFTSVDPGSYIVEILSSDQTAVLAASEIVNVNAGEVATTVVKLPFAIPPFAGILAGNAVAPASAIAVVTEAAVSGVLIAATPSPATPICPTQSF
jgi:hypothetical protein